MAGNGRQQHGGGSQRHERHRHGQPFAGEARRRENDQNRPGQAEKPSVADGLTG